jgi:starch synthase (maltosyl-transferring)
MPKKKTITNLPARSRAIIENVHPEVDNGRFFIKRAIGEKLRVECDLFGDGHDVVYGHLLFRKQGDKSWEETPLFFISNDRWFGEFELTETGIFEYTIEGWMDHSLNWQHEIERKIGGGQVVNIELLDGLQHLERVKKLAESDETQFLEDCISAFNDPDKYSHATDLACSDYLNRLFKKYPAKTFSLLYDRILQVRVDRRKALFSSWYEFFPRSTSPEAGSHGSFKDCLKVIPHVADMGFDVIYFPPIHPIGREHRKGKNNTVKALEGDVGSPWGIGAREGGHKSIHPDLGSLEDLKAVIKTAKKYQIEIALDLALQCAPDHPYVKEHPQWFKWRPDGTVQYAENPPKKYQDILPINFETDDWENLWAELLDIVLYWNKLGIKIFRVDNPHTKPFRFWEWCIAEAHKVDPDLIFLSEAFTKPKVMHELAKSGFTQSYTYFTWRNTKAELSEYVNELAHTPSREYFRPNFWPNTPDINPYSLQNDNEYAFMTRLFLAATLSSNYGIYGPVFEYMIYRPIPGKEEYLDSEKYEVKHWNWAHQTNVKRMMTQLNKIRKEQSALQDTFNVELCDTDNENLFAYYKATDEFDNHLLMVVNLDHWQMHSANVKLPKWRITRDPNQPLRMHDLITDQTFTWYDEWNYVELGGLKLPFHLFKVERV